MVGAVLATSRLMHVDPVIVTPPGLVSCGVHVPDVRRPTSSSCCTARCLPDSLRQHSSAAAIESKHRRTAVDGASSHQAVLRPGRPVTVNLMFCSAELNCVVDGGAYALAPCSDHNCQCHCAADRAVHVHRHPRIMVPQALGGVGLNESASARSTEHPAGPLAVMQYVPVAVVIGTVNVPLPVMLTLYVPKPAPPIV